HSALFIPAEYVVAAEMHEGAAKVRTDSRQGSHAVAVDGKRRVALGFRQIHEVVSGTVDDNIGPELGEDRWRLLQARQIDLRATERNNLAPQTGAYLASQLPGGAEHSVFHSRAPGLQQTGCRVRLPPVSRGR